MARRGGFERALMAAAREMSRQARIAEQNRKRALREQAAEARRSSQEAAREYKIRVASAKEADRERKAAHLEQRQQAVEMANASVREKIDSIEGILEQTLHVNDTIEFDSLRVRDVFKATPIPLHLLKSEAKPSAGTHLGKVKRPSGIALALLPWVKKRYELETAQAQALAEADANSWRLSEAGRLTALTSAQEETERRRSDFEKKVAMRNAEVDAFRSDYHAGDADAVVAYVSMVLERSEYPEDFPQNFSVAYQVQSKQLVVDYELPKPEIVPAVESYRYVKTRDEIEERPRKPAEAKALYADVLAAITLRTVHEISNRIAAHT